MKKKLIYLYLIDTRFLKIVIPRALSGDGL